MNKKIISLGTFKNMSEIKYLCPCAIQINTCEAEDTGEKFEVGSILTGPGKGTLLYPRGNRFARKTVIQIYGGKDA